MLSFHDYNGNCQAHLTVLCFTFTCKRQIHGKHRMTRGESKFLIRKLSCSFCWFMYNEVQSNLIIRTSLGLPSFRSLLCCYRNFNIQLSTMEIRAAIFHNRITLIGCVNVNLLCLFQGSWRLRQAGYDRKSEAILLTNLTQWFPRKSPMMSCKKQWNWHVVRSVVTSCLVPLLANPAAICLTNARRCKNTSMNLQKSWTLQKKMEH